MKNYLYYLLLFVFLSLASCGPKSEDTPNVLITPPAMTVTMTRENCPSMEAEVGMWLAWTNGDTVTLPIKIEQMDTNGGVIDTADSEIAPGDVFSMKVIYSGNYRVYCSDKTDVYGTITVK